MNSEELREGLKKSETDNPPREIERAPLENLFIDLKSLEENDTNEVAVRTSFAQAEGIEESLSLRKKKSDNAPEYDDFNPMPDGENPMVKKIKTNKALKKKK